MSLNIQLVNMPFGNLEKPAIGLTQLKARTSDVHGDAVRIDVNYLNHEFGRLLGPGPYKYIATHQNGLISGFGEWFFRQAAFPDIADNRDAYLARFGPYFGPEVLQRIERDLIPLRRRLPQALDELIERYRLDRADIVGLSSTFFQNLASVALARRLRRIRPDQIIVMGGANCEASMGAALIAHVPVIDYAFSGPSLVSFPQFVGKILAGDRTGCDQIDGVLSARNTAAAAPAGQELDINTPIPLDYDDFFASLDRLLPAAEVKADVLFETSRGCWWGERAHCTFCGLNGGSMAYRAMAPERALALIEGLIARYAGRTGSFECVDNILPREYVDQVFARLRPPPHVSLFYEVKADLTDSQLAALAAGGVRHIQPGIEALATSTLKLMRKGTTAFNNIRLLMGCHAHGIAPMWNLLVGFPGETAEVYATYQEILPDLFHLPPPSGVFPVRFDRFSPYFTAAKEYGLDLKPFDFYELCYPFPEAALMNMAYYFQDTNYAATYLGALGGAISGLRASVEHWRAAWSDRDGAAPPRLALVADDLVEDSRSGILRRIALTSAEAALLAEAVRPVDEEALARHGDALAGVRAKRLVFSERGRVMSLVARPRVAAGDGRRDTTERTTDLAVGAAA
jgi:ribosomal peptide maturation radical SAM protein 1